MPYFDAGRAGELRLRPEMASFRALVLAFVRDYVAAWGQSPSYGEIAAATGANRTRVKRAVASLERDGLLLRRPGCRGLFLPDELGRAQATLARWQRRPGAPVLDYPVPRPWPPPPRPPPMESNDAQVPPGRRAA